MPQNPTYPHLVGEPTEGIANAYDKAVALVQSAPRPIVITFRPPYPGEDDPIGGEQSESAPPPEDAVVLPPLETRIDEDHYKVEFYSTDLGINLIENVDPRREPVSLTIWLSFEMSLRPGVEQSV